MRVRFYTDGNVAAKEYNTLTEGQSPCILCGPVPYIAVQTELPAEAGGELKSTFIDKKVYVLISEFEPAVSNVVIARKIAAS